jgi:hypothetical protein
MGMYFEGAHFEFDKHDLTDNPVLAAHLKHSVTRPQYAKGKITYWKGMGFQEFRENNKDFFNAVARKYKRKKNTTK